MLVRWLRNLLAALGALVVLVSCTPLVSWWAGKLGGAWGSPKGEVLIIPSAERNADTVIGRSSYWRCVYGAMAFRTGGFRRVIVTGAGTAPLMRDFLLSQGVPAAAISVENAATSTRQNALFTKPLLGPSPGRIVLLTSDFHMYRAWRTFQKSGIRLEPRPFPDVRKMAGNWTQRFPAFLGLIEESAKIGWYWVRGWI